MDVFARLELKRSVPLVAEEDCDTYQPAVFWKVTLVRLLQPLNASLPMLVTLDGMVMLVRLLQLQNARYPMLVTLEGMVMLVRLLQP